MNEAQFKSELLHKLAVADKIDRFMKPRFIQSLLKVVRLNCPRKYPGERCHRIFRSRRRRSWFTAGGDGGGGWLGGGQAGGKCRVSRPAPRAARHGPSLTRSAR